VTGCFVITIAPCPPIETRHCFQYGYRRKYKSGLSPADTQSSSPRKGNLRSDILQDSHPLQRHLVSSPNHVVSSSCSGTVFVAADSGLSYSMARPESAEDSLHIGPHMSISGLSTIFEDVTANKSMVADSEAPYTQHPIISPRDTNTLGPSTCIYFCCNCGSGPQSVKLNPACYSCGATFCSRCSVRTST